jgi:hypothetical protein
MMLTLFALCAYPAPIIGLLTTDGTATVNLDNIMFASTTGVAGVFADSLPLTNSFFGLAGDDGTITNLNNGITMQPIGVSFSDPNWMVLSGPPNANISFDLTFVTLGDFTTTDCSLAPLAGQTCSLPGSPFDLTNDGSPGGTVTGVTISLALSGIVTNTLTGETSNFTGILNNSGQVIDATTGLELNTLQQIASAIEAGDNVTAGYTGAFSAVATPEPSTLMLTSLGVLLLAAATFKRKHT